jgi:DNA-directed RNA polymerase subunit F
MIRKMQPVTMCEVKNLIEGFEDSEKKQELDSFIKKFSKISLKDCEKLKKELSDLSISKLKEEQIVKIVDIMPEDSADLNKIFNDFGLDEEENAKVLEVMKKYL